MRPTRACLITLLLLATVAGVVGAVPHGLSGGLAAALGAPAEHPGRRAGPPVVSVVRCAGAGCARCAVGEPAVVLWVLGVTPGTLPGGAAGVVQTVQVMAGMTPSTAVNDVEITVTSATAGTVLGRGQVTVWRFTPGVCLGRPDGTGRVVLPYDLKPEGFAADTARLVVRSSDDARGVFEGPAPAMGGAGPLEAAWEEFDWVRVDPWAGPYRLQALLTVGAVSTATPVCLVELPRLTVREEAFATGLDTTTVNAACVPIAGTPLDTTTGIPNLFVPYSPVTGHTLTVLVEPPSAGGLVRLRSAALTTAAGGAVTWSVSQTGPMPASPTPVTIAAQASGLGVVSGAVNAERLWTRFNTSTVPARGFVVESAPMVVIPIVAHLVTDGSIPGTTVRTAQEVQVAFEVVNERWGRQAGVRFDLIGVKTTAVPAAAAQPTTDADYQLLASFGEPNKLDCYFLHDVKDSVDPNHPSVNGLSTFYPPPLGLPTTEAAQFVTVSDKSTTLSTTTAHELGHNLGLNDIPTAGCVDDIFRLMWFQGKPDKGVLIGSDARGGQPDQLNERAVARQVGLIWRKILTGR